MDVSHLIEHLNDRQREAVSAPLQSMLVLAGAGSGKTRVLVHRIAWLMQVEQASPFSIMAVTFTNKAAAEMRGRVQTLMGSHVGGMWLGTFHGLAHRFLRTHFQEASLPETFQILDSDDQYRFIRRTLKALNLDEKHYPPKQVQWFINNKKDEGLRPQHIESYDHTEKQMLKVYASYQEACDRAGLIDFAEILLRAHETLLKHPPLLRHYQQRFEHILVDEFQDTNTVQYAWLRLLAGEHGNITIVGDDDQSIYGWRGAKIENIHKFTNDFPNAQTIRLEQNYRSTNTILKAANQLIENNSARMGKELWTDGDAGEPISLYAAYNELDEARFIVNAIEQWSSKGNTLNDVAILYRNNAQSRALEDAIRQANLKYRIYGGQRFYDRQEIKDSLAYLRLITNRNDDAAFERIINTPARGIGERTLATVRDTAKQHGATLWQAALTCINDKLLSGRAANAIQHFIDTITAFEHNIADKLLHEQADSIIRDSGLYAMYQAEKGEKAKTRIENLQELVTACQQFTPSEDTENMTPLQAFLSQAALEAGDDQADEFEDAIQLMTLHSAKGLEFPLVFMAGVEEGMFPSQQSAEEQGRLEEERRLCYVGITRAMQKLYISYAETRRLYGQDKYHRPSRFIREIPDECIEEIRMRAAVTRPSNAGRFAPAASHVAFESTGFNLGQRVLHPKFGEGTVLNYEGSGDSARIQINFDAVGTKWLVTGYARLEAV
ncbi:DNA helicase II [Flocculibacter collagenilyticus]|uniref:DNA helicase II n=1 Tax=Flocculibacter collagenilyticus TaxID=2744479 RepID=UPI0018F5A009|nr:DNA helicase II [Flocculibacter collagenilyticus]